MESNSFCKINMKISMITELLLLSALLLLNKWVGNERFNFYIFSSVLCKVIGYGTIVSYPLIKLKSKIYEMEITGKKFEIMYAICILILFLVQILLIVFRIKFPLILVFLTSFYEVYYIFFNNTKI